MPVSVIYDLSRLITRVLNATPNGIDRVDWLLARHYLTHRQFETFALAIGFTGPRLLSHTTSLGATDRVAAAWNETSAKDQRSRAYGEVVAFFRAKREAPRRTGRIIEPRPNRILNIAQALLRYAPRLGRAPRASAPQDSFYMNAANFPLDWKRHVAWLDQRSDIRPIFFVHDLLPLARPEWFWANEPTRHARRLDLLARRGAAAIVATTSVEQDLRRRLDLSGRSNLPIFRRGLPVSQIFSEPAALDPLLADIPFFVTCGTIEPRKNHLLLLNVWRDLVARQGVDAPKLIIVGNRGWNSEKIVASLEDKALWGHVIEIAGLPTRDYKRLLDQCLALLAPSFAEGFGLPVAEALMAGKPVIASDIPSFREQGGDHLTYLDPRSNRDWREAILDFNASPSSGSESGLTTSPDRAGEPSETDYLSALDDFLIRL
jgi:glycosyltransferase involved in cell wall biosynthesis